MKLIIFKIIQILYLVQYYQFKFLKKEVEQNLIAYYPFNGNSDDVFANNNASNNGVTATTNRHGQNDKAYKFFDTTSYITIPENIFTATEEFSFTFWLNKEQDLENNSAILSMTLNGSKDFQLYTNGYIIDGITYLTTAITDQIVLNQWHHIGLTQTSIHVRLYFDGSLVYLNELSPTYTINLGVNGFVIGQDQNDLGSNFESQNSLIGKLSDFRIYDTDISPEQIYDIYMYERDKCGLMCQTCDTDQIKCSVCKGNRILGESGQCQCPQGLKDDYQSNDCLNSRDTFLKTDLLSHYPMNKHHLQDTVTGNLGNNYDCKRFQNRYKEDTASYEINDITTWLRLGNQDQINGKNQGTFSIWGKAIKISSVSYLLIQGTFSGGNDLLFKPDYVFFNDTGYKNKDGKRYIKYGIWQQYILVFSPSDFQVYINGDLIFFHDRNLESGSLSITNLVIGQDQDTVNGGFDNSDRFNGLVSDFRFYGRSFTKQEVKQLYIAESEICHFGCVSCLNLSYWCDSCKGNRILNHLHECCCPQGTQEDFISIDCPSINDLFSSGLQAYYPLHNNNTDVQNGNDGLIINLQPTTNRFDIADTAFMYVDTTTMFLMPNTLIDGQKKVTMSVWAKSTRDVNTIRPQFFNAASNTNENQIFISVGTLIIQEVVLLDNYNSLRDDLNSIYFKEWLKYLFVIDNTKLRYYVNGKLYKEIDKTEYEIECDPGGFFLGQDQEVLGGQLDVTQSWIGPMSDVRIYNKVLDSQNIQLLHTYEKYPCKFVCESCIIHSLECNECKGNRYFKDKDCICPVGTYEDMSSYNCPSCNYKCSECENDQDNCLSCQGNNRLNNYPDCDCIPNYVDDGQNKDCYLVCNTQCGTCEVTSDNCKTCSDTNRNINNNPVCSCNDYYYDDGTKTCKKCIQDKCIECKPQQPNQCIVVEEGYYQENNIIYQCPYKCKTCDQNGCLTCVDSLPERSINKQLCECPNGYYDQNNTQQCQKCLPQCKTCSNGKECKILQICQKQCKVCEKQTNFCLKCQGKYRTPPPECICIPNYYDDGQNIDCQLCLPRCELCENGNECTKCINPFYLLPHCVEEKQGKVIKNLNKFYLTQIYQEKCYIKCKNCMHEPFYCSECNIGKNRILKLPNCSCIKGYHDQEFTLLDCQKCPIGCNSCKNKYKCNSCILQSNRYLDEYTNQCECFQGFKQRYSLSVTCEPCYFYKNQCLFECPQNTIKDIKQKKCIDANFKTNFYMYLIYIGLILIIISKLVSYFLCLKKFRKQYNILKNKYKNYKYNIDLITRENYSFDTLDNYEI